MFSVETNCLGCHKDNKVVKGEDVAHGSGKACASCHTEKHEGMVKEWKEKTAEELKNAKEIEKEALDAIEKAKDKASKDKLSEATSLLKKGQENMQIVEYGGGVHNKKYSVMILDIAMNYFEDAIDLLSEEE
jgi:formate-dependent nitrite reductase cytochrome c552 subunit